MSRSPHRTRASSRLTLVAPFLFAVLWLGGCGEKGGAGDEANPTGDTALAEVAGSVITESQFDARLARVPSLARTEFGGRAGRRRLLDRMVEEEVLYRAAVDAGLHRDEGIVARLEEMEREMAVQLYLDRERNRAVQVDEDELRAFYEEHRDEYRTERTLRVRGLITKERSKASHARGAALDGLSDFADVCGRYCEVERLAIARGLFPEWVRKGRAVSWIGNHPEFHEAAFSTELGEISEVFETALGFGILRVEEEQKERERSFEEVRADILARIQSSRSTKALPELIASLREKYGAEIYDTGTLSSEELFAEAQEAATPRERIDRFEEFVAVYPDDPRAEEAWFMIGFLRAEELKDRDGARAAFERVIDGYPDSELAQSARWMLSSESGAPPEFESEAEDAEGTSP